MVQMLVKLEENEDRVLTIVKGKYGLKNKSEAVRFVIDKFEEEMLEPSLRPEYLEKLNKIKKQKGIEFRSMAELRARIENA